MRTAVSVAPLIDRRWIHGEDSLQSLCLAVHFVMAALRALQKKGSTFSLERDGQSVDFVQTLTGSGWGALEEQVAKASEVTDRKLAESQG